MFFPPGFLNKKVSGIEKEKQETIKRNLVRLEAAGVNLDAIKALSKKVFLPPEGEENLSSCSDDDESSSPPPKKAKVTTLGKKRVCVGCQASRKSQRIQQSGGWPNAASSTLPIEATVNHGEGMSAIVSQPFQLPNATNQLSSLPNVGGNIERSKDSHIRNRKGEEAVWISDKAKEHYGYKIHKNTCAANSQPMPNPEIDALKQVVANQAKIVADQAKVVAVQAKIISDYSTNFEMMMLFMAEKFGVDPATIPRCIPSMENGEDT